MTLRDTILLLERIASEQPAIHTLVRNDVYKLNEHPAVVYGAFAWTQGQHGGSLDSWAVVFRFSLFYVDRLTENGGNQIEVQSTAVSVLDNILRALAAQGVEVDPWTITTFHQKFTDVCAGAFAQVAIRVPNDSICVDSYDTTPGPSGVLII